MGGRLRLGVWLTMTMVALALGSSIRHGRSRSHLRRSDGGPLRLARSERGTSPEPPPRPPTTPEEPPPEEPPQLDPRADVVTRFLRIVESQHLLGENCTAGTALNLGEGVVDRYAQVGATKPPLDPKAYLFSYLGFQFQALSPAVFARSSIHYTFYTIDYIRIKYL